MTTTQLTFTRSVAAFFIVYYHFGGNLFAVENSFFKILQRNLNLGVDYFYVLSGFVMMLAYGHKSKISTKEYYVNRVARIYPLHLFTLFLSILVTVLISINYLSHLKFSGEGFLLHFFLLQSWNPYQSLSYNVPAWSVSVEMFFYFCFPFVFNHILKKFGKAFTYALFISFWIFCQSLMNQYYFSDHYGGDNTLDRYFLFFNPAFHISTFFIGILFGHIFIENKDRLNRNNDILIFLIFAASAISVVLMDEKFFLHNGLLAVPFGLLIMAVAGNTGKLTNLFNHKTMVHLGDISFAMYLLQNPVFHLSGKILKVANISNPFVIFFSGVVVLLAASHFTYQFIEIPLRDKIRNLKFLK